VVKEVGTIAELKRLLAKKEKELRRLGAMRKKLATQLGKVDGRIAKLEGARARRGPKPKAAKVRRGRPRGRKRGKTLKQATMEILEELNPADGDREVAWQTLSPTLRRPSPCVVRCCKADPHRHS